MTHPDKVLLPRDGIDKAELARYCADVAPFMVPHTRGRPVRMHVFPGAIDGRGHYAKNVQAHFPDWITGPSCPSAVARSRTWWPTMRRRSSTWPGRT